MNGITLKNAFEVLMPEIFEEAAQFSAWNTFLGLELLFDEFKDLKPSDSFIEITRSLRSAFVKFIPHRVAIAVEVWRLILTAGDRAGFTYQQLNIPQEWEKYWSDVHDSKKRQICAYPNVDKCVQASDCAQWCRVGCALPEDLACYYNVIKYHFPECVEKAVKSPPYPCHFTPPPAALYSVAIEGTLGKEKAASVRLTDEEVQRIKDPEATPTETDTLLVDALLRLRKAMQEAQGAFERLNRCEQDLERAAKQLFPLTVVKVKQEY